MPVKHEMICGPCQETSYIGHHVEPRAKLYSPREESFPIPLKYIDVSRTTQTNLDVMQQSRIDDYWNIDGSRDLPDSWTGFTQFTLLEEKPPDGFLWSGERLTRQQLTSRPDHLWPELWKSMGKNAKLKEKQKWAEEKIHLDNARKLRGIYFIDPEDREVKETIKNARKKLETSVAPAMPCKIIKNCGSGASDKIQTKLACILQADESTRMRMGNSEPSIHEDHIAGKGENSLQHYNLVHKFIPMPQALKNPAPKAALDKEWEKLEKISAWNLTKVKSKKKVIDEARTSGEMLKLKEKHKWTIEKPKLDNARRLRGIYFIDLEDKEFKETIRNARKKLETPVAPGVPCKTCKKSKKGETRGKTNDFKSKFPCILEASESTRLRMEESLPNYHEYHIA